MFELIFFLLFTVAPLLGAYVIGTTLERRHFRSIRAREDELRAFPTVTLRQAPAAWQAQHAELVIGHVVVSIDYFKRFLAGLRTLVGGRVRAFESVLDRGRREALLRMQEQARAGGFDAVIGVRYETSRLASARPDGQGTSGVEVMAFGTAVRVTAPSSSAAVEHALADTVPVD